MLAILMYMLVDSLSSAGATPEHHAARRRRTAGASGSQSLRDVWASLLLFLFVIGGMYCGFFTVTEAAGVGAVGALLIGIARGRLSGRGDPALRCSSRCASRPPS